MAELQVKKKRYVILDALRGFAILGIILANFPEFSLWTFAPDASHTTDDRVVHAILTYFVDGRPVLDCPVVTGRVYGHSTPKGTYTLNYKSRNLTLKGREDNGDEYSSFVNYWMAFIGSSYGLHDATWRTNFGGDIYKSGGSHGCVNMPYKSAAQLYEIIEPGTPILIY